jgi:hypothetical protein
MKKLPTLTELLDELDRICDEFGLEKTANTPRYIPRGEYGYLKAYEIWKQRNGYTTKPKKTKYTIVLTARALNYVNIHDHVPKEVCWCPHTKSVIF